MFIFLQGVHWELLGWWKPKGRDFEAKTWPCGDQIRACVVAEEYGGEETSVPVVLRNNKKFEVK